MVRQDPPASLLLTAGIKDDFLPVPAENAFSTEDSLELAPRVALPPALPAVWQDFFVSLDKLNSPDYLNQVACSSSSAEEGAGEPSIGPDTVFCAHLCPETLIRRHRLGLPEIKRMYQALQVYSVGFHQALSEVTCHAVDKGHLLLAVWRGFAMLWDSALQAVFTSETVKLSREQQTAVLSAESALALLRECKSGKEALAAENAALTARVEAMVVEMLSVQADASVLAQSARSTEAEAEKLRQEVAEVTKALRTKSAEANSLQVRLAEVSSPELVAKVERLGRLLEDKEGMLKDASRREAAVRQERDAAESLARAERVKREEAHARAQLLEGQVGDLLLKLRALQSECAGALGEYQMLKDRVALLQGADSQFGAWQERAAAAEARARAAEECVAALEEQLKVEKARNEELVDSVWPLAAKIKVLEVQLGGGQQAQPGGGGMGVG